ncbi:MAG TPA: hypothetical protein VFJ96_14600 [Gemmatimonadaceae bacterium]|nr:hypothetical protein [Gemmatimonadaceae bacterium]
MFAVALSCIAASIVAAQQPAVRHASEAPGVSISVLRAVRMMFTQHGATSGERARRDARALMHAR